MYKKAAIAILSSYLEVEAALKALHSSGLDMKKLSIIGKDYLSVDQAKDYYKAADCMNYWGKSGDFWGPLWGTTALVAALYSIGIPRDKIIRFETAIKQGFFVLIIHGTADDICKARESLIGRGHQIEVFASKERLQQAPSLSKLF